MYRVQDRLLKNLLLKVIKKNDVFIVSFCLYYSNIVIIHLHDGTSLFFYLIANLFLLALFFSNIIFFFFKRARLVSKVKIGWDDRLES